MTTVILHHGLLGGGMSVGTLKWPSFRQIDAAIAQKGYSVFVSAVHPTASVEKRARQLKQWLLPILQNQNHQSVVLIAHSMGGLDAHFMLAELGMAKYVSALVTVCTPHRGSPWADWVFERFGKRWHGLQWAQKFGLEVGALPDLTTERCAIFNREVPNVPGVRYYSVSASRPGKDMPAFARFSHGVIFKAEGRNDGLVSVRSAQWGTHLCTWRMDHWQSINRKYSWQKRHNPPNIADNYLAVLETAERGIAT